MAIGLKLSFVACLIMAALQTTYLFIPTEMVLLYERAVRPAIYALLAVMVCVFMGCDIRHIPKSYEINIVSVFSALLYASAFTVMVHFMGGGINAAQPGSLIIIGRSVWTVAVPVILSALIGFKLIGAVRKHSIIILLLTLAFAFENLGALRQFIRIGNLSVQDFIFAHLFVAITISAALSFFCLRGNILSVIAISAVYILTPYFVPIIPHVNPIVWGLMVCGLLFISTLVLHLFTHEKNRLARKREERNAKYEKKSVLRYRFILAAIIFLIFNMRMLPIYPVIILTESMTGTFNRGSIVFMHRVRESDVFTRVGMDAIIHFNHGQIEIVHRVVGFSYDAYGVRQYTTQGDANEMADPFPVVQANVLGIPVASIPFLGYPYVVIINLIGR